MEPEIPKKPTVTASKVVQTFAGDMAEVIESDKAGLVKKIIHGEEQNEAEKINLSPQSKKNRIFLFISILLIMASCATLAYFASQKGPAAVAVAPQFVPLVFTEKSDYIEVGTFSTPELTQAVLNEVNTTTVPEDGVEGIYLTVNKQIVGLRQFITLINGNFSPDPNPLLVSDNFLMGVVNNAMVATPTQGNGFFILLKVRSNQDIFDSMHAWEPKMFSDLHGFLGITIDSANQYLLTKDFADGVIENKNARILSDNAGNIVLMYVYADDNSVVIASTESAADEIMLRLSGSQAPQ